MLIRRPAPPRLVGVSKNRLVLETGIDLPEGQGSLPVSVQLYLSETPLDDDMMPPVALEETRDLSASRETVELDLSALTAANDALRYGRVLVHFRRSFAIDPATCQIAAANFEL